jgi:putative sigma-54 modulation protein
MQLAITFRNFDASEALKDHTRERLERLVRNLDRAWSAHVVLSLERHLHHADLTFSTGPLVLRAKLTSPDMYTSVDLAVDCLEEQLRRDKDRNKHHHRRAWVHHQQGTFAEVEITVEDAA